MAQLVAWCLNRSCDWAHIAELRDDGFAQAFLGVEDLNAEVEAAYVAAYESHQACPGHKAVFLTQIAD
jgi:hypothetical protein